MVVMTKNGHSFYMINGQRNVAPDNWEGYIVEELRARIKDHGLFVDVGANTGAYTIYLAEDFDRVVAIEPHPINADVLRETVKLNEFENVEVLQTALWSEPATLYLHQRSEGDLMEDSRTMLAPMEKDERTRFLRNMPVNAVKFDSLGLDPSVVKIDVVGSEMEVLKGMSETIKRCHPLILVETYNIFGVSKESVRNFLKGLGYDFKNLSDSGETAHDIFEYSGIPNRSFDIFEDTSEDA